MSHVFSRAIIRRRWRFVHRCEKLIGLQQPKGPLDQRTVAIVYETDKQWYVRDRNHRTYLRVSHCPGCGNELAEQFSAVQALGQLDPEAIARLPKLKGLEG